MLLEGSASNSDKTKGTPWCKLCCQKSSQQQLNRRDSGWSSKVHCYVVQGSSSRKCERHGNGIEEVYTFFFSFMTTKRPVQVENITNISYQWRCWVIWVKEMLKSNILLYSELLNQGLWTKYIPSQDSNSKTERLCQTPDGMMDGEFHPQSVSLLQNCGRSHFWQWQSRIIGELKFMSLSPFRPLTQKAAVRKHHKPFWISGAETLPSKVNYKDPFSLKLKGIISDVILLEAEASRLDCSFKVPAFSFSPYSFFPHMKAVWRKAFLLKSFVLSVQLMLSFRGSLHFKIEIMISQEKTSFFFKAIHLRSSVEIPRISCVTYMDGRWFLHSSFTAYITVGFFSSIFYARECLPVWEILGYSKNYVIVL